MEQLSSPGSESNAEQVALPITRTAAAFVYASFVFGWFFPPIILLGLIINLLRRGRAKGTWLETHYFFQVRWFLILVAMAVLFIMLGSGAAYLVAVLASMGIPGVSVGVLLVFLPWILFEIKMVQGWVALSNNQSV